MSLPVAAPPTPGSVWCVYCDAWYARDDMRVEFGARCPVPTDGVLVTGSVGAPYAAGICLHHDGSTPLPPEEVAALEAAFDLHDGGNV